MISPLLLGTSESYKKSWCIIEITCSWLTTIGEPLFTLIEARMGFQYHTNWMEECCWRIDKVDNLVDLKCCMTGLTNSLTIYVHSIETWSHSETRYSTAKTIRQSRPHPSHVTYRKPTPFDSPLFPVHFSIASICCRSSNANIRPHRPRWTPALDPFRIYPVF